MGNTIELKDLVGEHLLTGVDFETTRVEEWEGSNSFQDAQCVNFTLDGITYTAIEDPEDGYRSAMRELKVSAVPTTNTFAPVRVLGQMKPDEGLQANDVLELLDCETGKTVLEIGTENTNVYYPCFVASFTPEAMACNQKPTP